METSLLAHGGGVVHRLRRGRSRADLPERPAAAGGMAAGHGTPEVGLATCRDPTMSCSSVKAPFTGDDTEFTARSQALLLPLFEEVAKQLDPLGGRTSSDV